MWARSYKTHIANDILDMFKNSLTSIFDDPAAIYSDNESYLVNAKVSCYFKEKGSAHFTRPISHLSSTGLIKWGVQGKISFLGTKTIEHEAAGSWYNLVKDGAFFYKY